jgi:hypothetical protein
VFDGLETIGNDVRDWEKNCRKDRKLVRLGVNILKRRKWTE